MPFATPEPGCRQFTRSVRVRLGDVSPKGRLRLDGIARILQDVATDDALDGAPGEDASWVVRRTTIAVDHWPRYREDLTVTTWCSGYGRRWALRRTRLAGAEGGAVDTEALWIHIDPDTGRPTPLSAVFHEGWAPGVTVTDVSARRRQPDPPPAAAAQPWPVRFTDFDGLAHVNNAAYWVPVEEDLAARDLTPPFAAEIEYRDGVTRGEGVEVLTTDGDGGSRRLWWRVGSQIRAAAHAGPAAAVVA